MEFKRRKGVEEERIKEARLPNNRSNFYLLFFSMYLMKVPSEK
jgi:hypothetical protein